MIEAAILVVFPLCMAMAAFSDLLTMTIPNRLSIILIGSFLCIAPFAGVAPYDILLHIGAGLAVFAVCFALFALHIMGGGDAKILTASAVWFGLNASLMHYIVYVSVFGGLLSLVVLALRANNNMILASGLRIPATMMHAKKIPYGIAIGAAAFMAFPESPLMAFVLGH